MKRYTFHPVTTMILVDAHRSLETSGDLKILAAAGDLCSSFNSFSRHFSRMAREDKGSEAYDYYEQLLREEFEMIKVLARAYNSLMDCAWGT